MALSAALFFDSLQCTEVHFASFLSGGFNTATVVNPPERKLAKRTSVQWTDHSQIANLGILTLSLHATFLELTLDCTNKQTVKELESGI